MEKEKETLLNNTYQRFMDIGLGKINDDDLQEIVDEKLMGFGTTTDEKIFGLGELKALIARQNEQSKGLDMQVDIRPVAHYIAADENTAFFADDIFMYVRTGDELIEMYMRFSIVLTYTGNQWKVIHWHGSKPEHVASEEDTWGIENWKRKAEALEIQVQERTADLVTKNRELEIEAALEKVRSRSMAMRKSDELNDVVAVLFEKIKELQIPATAVGIAIPINDSKDLNAYVCGENEAGLVITNYRLPYFENVVSRDLGNALRSQLEFYVGRYSKEEKNAFYEYLFEHSAITNVPDDIRQMIFESPSYTITMVAAKKSLFNVNDFEGKDLSDHEIDVIKRFAKVFDQAYTRFLDLQKAEAQARESEIQLALERVRARSLAMHHSDELTDVVKLLYKEFDNLKLSNESTDIEIGLIDEETGIAKVWAHLYLSDGTIETFHFPFSHFDEINHEFEKWKSTPVEKRNELFITTEFSDDRWERFKELAREVPALADMFDSLIKANIKKWVTHNAYFSHGLLTIQGTEHYSQETQVIQKRFAKVFEQTYTRFLDLQKAEEQTRESQIEAALERIRSRSLAMHHSSELSSVVDTLLQEFTGLNFSLTFCIINLIDGDDLSNTVWAANPETGKDAESYYMKFEDYDFHRAMWKAWKEQDKRFVYVLEGEEKKIYDEYLYKDTEFSRFPKHVQDANKALERYVAGFTFFKHSGLQTVSVNQITEQELAILERFGNVFEQAYTRFLDLQKAEAQARESQIQLALERVRAKTMAMQKSEELNEAAADMFKQIQSLGMHPWGCGFNIFDAGEKAVTQYMSLADGGISPPFRTPLTEDPFFIKIYEARKSGEELFVWESKGESLAETYRYMFGLPGSGEIFGDLETSGFEMPKFQITHCAYFTQGYLVFITYEEVPEAHEIFKRFAKVFEQTYTRFLDLQKAEAQAREAQIEYALEKVRSQTMGMQSSKDLSNVTTAMFEQLRMLGSELYAAGIVFCDKDKDYVEQWHSVPGAGMLSPFIVPINLDHIHQYRYDQWEKRTELFSIEIPEDFIAHHFEAMFNLPTVKAVLDDFAAKNIPMPETPSWEIDYGASFRYGYLLISALKPLQETTILPRFAKVFEQTYTRFLDLQKAEAQAREARIEMALEKIRSRTMAMQHSDELPQAANLLFLEVQALDIPAWSCGYNILSEDKKSSLCIMSSEGELQTPFILPLTEHYTFQFWHRAIINNEEFVIDELEGNDIKEHYDYMQSLPELQEVFQQFRDAGLTLPTYQINHLVRFTHGFLLFITYQQVPEAHDIFKRFTRVFEQTYTRFLDLKKAEAQAKESTIEAALERVRAHTMAMQKSEELPAVTKVMFDEFKNLQDDEELEKMSRGFILTIDEERNAFDLWITDLGGNEIKQHFEIEFNEPITGKKLYQSWKSKQASTVIDLTGDELEQWLNYLQSKNLKIDRQLYGERRVNNFSYYSNGFLGVTSSSPISDENQQILLRFARVFEQTFTRFIDLQKSELAARIAVKQAALDRIRADIASMRTISDLDRITPLIWNELTILGVPFIRCGVFIMDEEKLMIQTFLSTPDGKAIAAFHLPYATPGKVGKIVDNWRQEKEYIDHWDKEEFKKFAHTLVQQNAMSSVENYLKTIPDDGFYLHFFPFMRGMLYVGNTEKLEDEKLALVQSITDAFSTAYARYEDFNKLEAAKKQVDITLSELQMTQKQLIQSEKMASLGELTAGIAHEIQNPLNFVNNFSEVSNELLGEMLEAAAEGDMEEVKEILNDVRQNLEKINHHGKRADGIVKGMLQHSRKSEGKKEPTDINALCDEYLRLAYHGLRAKDKSFNADFKTAFDPALGNTNIIPQDIGRVLLNLINNAFYAVNEKAKQHSEGYKPMVIVKTFQIPPSGGGGAEISVSDNGNGIPDSIKEKIFQPFFTTKPTGQGTGLGLSLSYDIVKAHGGEFTVETKEDEGSAFTIKLPIN